MEVWCEAPARQYQSSEASWLAGQAQLATHSTAQLTIEFRIPSCVHKCEGEAHCCGEAPDGERQAMCRS